MPPRFIARQLARPTGFLGRIVGLMLNRSNAKLNAFAIDQLEIGPSDRVLEVGFGGGGALPGLLQRAACVEGVDVSRDVVRWARAVYATSVASGRASFREASVENMPFSAASFDKVLTVNTIYFWPDLEAAFKEIGRVLKPRGRAAVGFVPKEFLQRFNYPTDIFGQRTPDEVAAGLAAAGFTSVRVEIGRPKPWWNVIIAER